MARYGSLEQTFERRGGYTYEVRIRQTLTGLGFEERDYYRPINQLSGGQRTRALLAQLLLEDPDLLMLDEPTNHLDIQAVEWLESFLKDWDGALVVVSHDRYFLDQVAHTIWEMTPALEVYRGNYSAYLTQREGRYARRLAEYEAQNAFIEKEQEYIRRNIAGQNTSQAKGRQRRLERLLEDARLAPPPNEPRRMHINLNTRGRSGDLVLRTHNLQVGYHDEGRPLFDCPDLTLIRQECAAIIGPNGAGKTTFLKTILEKIPPYSGTVQLGASLEIGYFAQAHEGLDPDKSLMQEISSVAPNLLPPRSAITWRSSFSPETTSSARSSRFRAASAAAWRWPSSHSPMRTCCCWTSRPTTSTCPPRKCWSRSFPISPARSCWSHTTAT